MSTRPQLGTQLGKEFHACSYAAALLVTSAPVGVSVQVSAVLRASRSPHSVDNPGGGAPCRPVDERTALCTHRRPAGPTGPERRRAASVVANGPEAWRQLPGTTEA